MIVDVYTCIRVVYSLNGREGDGEGKGGSRRREEREAHE